MCNGNGCHTTWINLQPFHDCINILVGRYRPEENMKLMIVVYVASRKYWDYHPQSQEKNKRKPHFQHKYFVHL
jgi:hypothetical protein